MKDEKDESKMYVLMVQLFCSTPTILPLTFLPSPLNVHKSLPK